MELYKRLNMKDMLATSLYQLMMEKPFEKITIKQITDKTGVIRGTFYNHFYDKYETLEYLAYMMLVNQFDNHIGEQEFINVVKNIIKEIDANKKFIAKCFKVEGQNSFESMLTKVFRYVFDEYTKEHSIHFSKCVMNKDLFLNTTANMIVYVIKEWVMGGKEYTYEEICKVFEMILTKSHKDLLDELR